MGQSTAATLHELSTHLSVLNLDIDDLNQQHASSQAIGNAKDSIAHINKMVRQAKHQLDTYGDYKTFNVHTVINRCVQDMQEKFARRNVTLANEARLVNTTTLKGSPLALMQVLTILLNNALEIGRAHV